MGKTVPLDKLCLSPEDERFTVTARVMIANSIPRPSFFCFRLALAQFSPLAQLCYILHFAALSGLKRRDRQRRREADGLSPLLWRRPPQLAASIAGLRCSGPNAL